MIPIETEITELQRKSSEKERDFDFLKRKLIEVVEQDLDAIVELCICKPAECFGAHGTKRSTEFHLHSNFEEENYRLRKYGVGLIMTTGGSMEDNFYLRIRGTNRDELNKIFGKDIFGDDLWRYNSSGEYDEESLKRKNIDHYCAVHWKWLNEYAHENTVLAAELHVLQRKSISGLTFEPGDIIFQTNDRGSVGAVASQYISKKYLERIKLV